MSVWRAGQGSFVAGRRSRRLLPIVLAGFAAVLGGLPATSANAAPLVNVPLPSVGALLAIRHDPAAIANDQFGRSVAVSGATAIVGSPNISDTGAAYIYLKGLSGWPKTPTVTLADPAATPNAFDDFGYSVALSGTAAIVGRPGASGYGGIAYIYEKGASGWPATPTAALADPGPAEGLHYFGLSVAVSGSTVIVGAPGTNISGAVYIYEKGPSGWPTTPTVTLDVPAGAFSFGDSVAVSGSTAMAADPTVNTQAGAAYIYVKGTAGWPKTPDVTLADPTDTPYDTFGTSVALSSTAAIVGAKGVNSARGAAYVYMKGISGWPAIPTVTLADPTTDNLQDLFGSSVALSSTAAVVGAPGVNSARGATYVYVKGISGWPATPAAALADPGGRRNDNFGQAAAVSATTAVVGAPGNSFSQGAAYIYRA